MEIRVVHEPPLHKIEILKLLVSTFYIQESRLVGTTDIQIFSLHNCPGFQQTVGGHSCPPFDLPAPDECNGGLKNLPSFIH